MVVGGSCWSGSGDICNNGYGLRMRKSWWEIEGKSKRRHAQMHPVKASEKKDIGEEFLHNRSIEGVARIEVSCLSISSVAQMHRG
jgi:hypothetical protein